MKKVSIVMTTYNGERHLREQLDSLLAQTYPLHEIIVQDDGSTDQTMQILNEYAERNAVVHVFKNEAEHGVNGNLYSAMRRASGELIAICDQDDIWEPQKIEEQVAMIGNDLLIAGQTIPFSTDGSEVAFDSRTPNHHVLRLLFASAVPGHSMLLRPEILECYEPNNTSCYDAHLQVVAAAMERFKFQGVCPVHQRRHASAMTYTKPVNSSHALSNMFRYIGDCIRIYPKAHPVLLQRMKAWETLLRSVKAETPSLHLALRMTRLMQARSPWAMLKLMVFCMKQRRWLFHTVENDSLMLRIRALMFPLTAVYYFRNSS